VKRGEVRAVDGMTTDFFSRSRNELNNTSRETSFDQDLVEQVVGVDSTGRRLPENNVTHQSRSSGQVTTDSGKVEGRDSQDETFKTTEFSTVPGSGSILGRLLKRKKSQSSAAASISACQMFLP